MVEIKPGIEVPDEELSFSTARSGGPGGQHVNKTSSKVIVRFDLEASSAFTETQRARMRVKIPPRYLTSKGEVVVSSERFRDQHKNREDAVEKLAAVLRAALARPKTRIATKPGKAAKARRRADKEQASRRKQERGRRDYE